MFWFVIGKIIEILLFILVILSIIAFIKKPSSVFQNAPEQQNPMMGKKVQFVYDDSEIENADGVRGHLEAVGDSEKNQSCYRIVKRFLDIVLSFCGLVVLSPLFLFLSIWILLDDPGPILFTQKRVGLDKQYFKLHKFRSMKMCTPARCIWVSYFRDNGRCFFAFAIS